MTWRAVRRTAAALLALAGLVVATPQVSAAGSSAPALDRPAVGAGSLSIRIVELDPAIPGPGDVLTLRGTITNTSDQPVRSVQANLRVSPTPLVNRDEIPEVLAGSGQRTGLPVPGTQDPVTDELAPGTSVPFQVSADVDDLGMSASGVYVTGAEALGDSGAGSVRQDIDRTFLPWWSASDPIAPLLLTTIWPLTGAPLRDADGVLLTEDAAVEMSPAGRLSRLLDAGAATPGAVSLIVDPEAVDAAADLANGYRVRTPAGTVEAGTRSREVASWLASLRTALSDPGADVTGSLYAWPDVDAARRGKLLPTVLGQQSSAEARAEEILGTPLAGTVVLPPGGVARSSTLAGLAGARVRAVVLSDSAQPEVEPSYFTPSGNVLLPTRRGDLPALLADSQLSDTLALPMSSQAEQTAVRQALLAQTLVTAGELRETQRLVVASIDPTWDPPAGAAETVVQALTGAPWVEPTSLAAAVEREPSTLARVQVQPTTEQVAEELPPAHVAQVRTQYEDLLGYATVVSGPDPIPEVTRSAPTRLLGAWFRAHRAIRTELTDIVTEQVTGLVDSVRIVSSGSITVSGASGTIPITVENSGPNPVTVGLVLTSSPPQLFSAEPTEPFTIDPERRTSVVVTAHVAGSGPIPVTIQLVTATGKPFGTAGLLVVESSAYANAARVLVQLALAALVLTVAVHGIRRARKRRRSRAEQHQPPAGTTSSSSPRATHD